jgi:S-(hydroxymethyl)glutathione dehydrogenase / alcohol dehydrogenase
VIGCGGIGLNTIQFLRCFGAFPIIAADLIEEKLLAARKFGATHTINASKEDPTEAARSITDGGVDKSFEAIGNTKTADQIIRATRPGGTAVIIGGLGRVPFTISDGRFTMNEIKVTGVASRRTNDVNEVLSMVREQRIEVQSLVTRKYSFEDINEALKELRQGSLLMGISLWN